MARKVIIDVDPGIDDALALCMALFDPRLEVVAVTAVAGNVGAEQATRNVQTLIEQLDPPRLPRIGAAVDPDDVPHADTRWLHGPDGLGGATFAVAELHNIHPAEKVIVDEVRAHPDSITIIALGPLTNIALAMRRDPALAGLIGQLVISGGTVEAPGNATPAAEYNIYRDPRAARDVLRSRTTKTIVPLDVTRQVPFTFGHVEQAPPETTAAGRLMRPMLAHAFRAYRQHLGMESLLLQDTVALVAATNPELFTTERLAGDVELAGELTLGATIFDRRPAPQWRPNVNVALEVHGAAVTDAILRSLAAAGRDTC